MARALLVPTIYYWTEQFSDVAHAVDASFGNVKMTLKSVRYLTTSIAIFTRWPCYVAVCNNYAICNTLQTALNCNAVCNTSYFKLRCEGNAICNVLQIASKFYHLKILKWRKKLVNCKMHRFNNILL